MFDFDVLAVPDVSVLLGVISGRTCDSVLRQMGGVHRNAFNNEGLHRISRGYENWRRWAPQARASAIHFTENPQLASHRPYHGLVSASPEGFADAFGRSFQLFYEEAGNIGQLGADAVELAFALSRSYENRLVPDWTHETSSVATRDRVWTIDHNRFDSEDATILLAAERHRVVGPVELIQGLARFVEELSHRSSLVKALEIESNLTKKWAVQKFLRFMSIADIFKGSQPFAKFSRGLFWLEKAPDLYIDYLLQHRGFPYSAAALESSMNAFLRVLFSNLSQAKDLWIFRSQKLLKYGDFFIVTPFFQLAIWTARANHSLAVDRVKLLFMEPEELGAAIDRRPVAVSTVTKRAPIPDQGELSAVSTFDPPSFASEPVLKFSYQLPSDITDLFQQWTDPKIRLLADQIGRIEIINEEDKNRFDSLFEILFADFDDIAANEGNHVWILSQSKKLVLEQNHSLKMAMKWRALLMARRLSDSDISTDTLAEDRFEAFVTGTKTVDEIIPDEYYQLRVNLKFGVPREVRLAVSPSVKQFLKDYQNFSDRILRALQKGVVQAEGMSGVKRVNKHERVTYEIKVYGRGIGHKRIGIVETIGGDWYLSEIIDWD